MLKGDSQGLADDLLNHAGSSHEPGASSLHCYVELAFSRADFHQSPRIQSIRDPRNYAVAPNVKIFPNGPVEGETVSRFCAISAVIAHRRFT